MVPIETVNSTECLLLVRLGVVGFRIGRSEKWDHGCQAVSGSQ